MSLFVVIFFFLTEMGDLRFEGIYVKEIDVLKGEEVKDKWALKNRLRLCPSIKPFKTLELNAQADFVWENGTYAERDYAIDFRKAWFRWLTPIGLLSAGRMPNEWGLGIFINSGDGYDERFGVKRYGDIVDRILFATKPLGKEEPLVVALAFDRIVEDDLRINKDDVDEWLLAIMWEEEWWKTGFYSALRTHGETDTKIGAFDIWGKAEKENWKIETELVTIYGKSKALPLLYEIEKTREILQFGFALEFLYRIKSIKFYLQSGFASGDENPAGGDMTFFTFDPDYNVGLVAFEKVLAYYTKRSVERILQVSGEQKGIDQFFTKGGVTNAYFFFPQIGINLTDKIEWRTGWLFARGVKNFVDPYETAFLHGGKPTGFNGNEPSKDIGWEIDTGLFFNMEKDKKLKFSIEGGYFSPGKVFSSPDGVEEGAYDLEGRLIVFF
jgi:hypothetical protein